jgi:hypothetical protein
VSEPCAALRRAAERADDETMRLLLPLVLGTVGLGLLAGAGFAAQDTMDLREVADRVPARVVGVATSTDEDGTSYAPIYEYVVDGRAYRHEASVSSSSRPELGSVETMLVHPQDPSDAKPETFLGQWFLAALLGGMGAGFTLVSLALATVGLRRRSADRSRPPLDSLGSPGEPVRSSHEGDHADHDPFVGDSPASSRGPFL